MTREEAIKSALKFLVRKQQEQGSWGYADNDDTHWVLWDEIIRWVDQQPCGDVPDTNVGDLISRQPEKRTEERTKTHACDCISRQAAIIEITWNGNNDMISKQDAVKCLRKLPSVEPKRKPGKWIDGKCNKCGTHAPFWAMSTTYYCSEYCPKCGADMREVQDEH